MDLGYKKLSGSKRLIRESATVGGYASEVIYKVDKVGKEIVGRGKMGKRGKSEMSLCK